MPPPNERGGLRELDRAPLPKQRGLKLRLNLALVLAVLLNLVAMSMLEGSVWPYLTSTAIVLISIALIMQHRLTKP